MSNESTISVETMGAIGVITLNHPQTMNALTLEMLNELACQVQTFDYDENIRSIVIQGTDQAFAAGIDLKQLSEEISQQSFALDLWREEFVKIENCTKPIIAAVAGYALGIGCELALACDIILAADNARFGHPEISLGTLPGFGACSKLTHAIGRAKTMETILTGKGLTADEAERSGLVSRIVPLSDLKAEALRVADRIVALPPQAVIQCKDTIKQAANMTLPNAISLEQKTTKLTLNTREFYQQIGKIGG